MRWRVLIETLSRELRGGETKQWRNEEDGH